MRRLVPYAALGLLPAAACHLIIPYDATATAPDATWAGDRDAGPRENETGADERDAARIPGGDVERIALPSLEVVDVFMPLTRLYRGMRQVPLELTLRNVSSQSVEARTIALLGDLVASPTEGVRFGEFDPPAGQALEPDALVVVRFYGRVDEDAAAPSADAIPLQINERAAEGGVSVRLAEGIEIPQFELIEVQRLIVDTSEDTASGRNQSLRAALSLANTMGGGPIVVSFAGEDFEGLDPRPITIGNLPLPKIQTNDLQIDGNGVQVEIVGSLFRLAIPGSIPSVTGCTSPDRGSCCVVSPSLNSGRATSTGRTNRQMGKGRRMGCCSSKVAICGSLT